MDCPPRIAFHGLEPSDSLRLLVERRLAKLELAYPRITSCRVAIEQPHRHHRRGGVWHVNVRVGVPGDEIAVSREAERGGRHRDAAAAVRDAFDAVRRQLNDRAER